MDISGLPLPWQALTLRAMGKAWPIVRSFEEPGADRPIERAVFWTAGDYGSYTAPLEAQVLSALFGSRMQIINGDQVSKGRFLEEYKRDDLDLLWVVAHGEFDHYKPHQVSFRISSTESCGLTEMQRPRSTQERRRLLVFNVCEGGATASLNAPGELGLAALLAGASQAIVSHFCPIEPRIALLFGALLAARLASGGGYFDSFEAALSIMLQGPEKIRAALGANSATALLVEHLDRLTLPLENILEVGTAVFYE